ncbi:hypothetical protein [Marinobacter algicola]|uniref:hypothetical protein n=1 Tax=Marinobacter algicola TaxID=236100 RepID=UPI003BAA396C
MGRFPRLRIKGPLEHFALQRDISDMLQRTLDMLLDREFRGIDPGSYYSSNLRRFRARGNGIVHRAWNKAFSTAIGWGGVYFVNLFALPEITSTKAAALTLSGLAHLRNRPDICDPVELEKTARALFDWLVERQNQELGAWTPDFQYEIHGTPIPQTVLGTINTVFCCEALWQWRDHFASADGMICSAAKACLDNLPRLESDLECCFSYNPAARYYVHNANLFVALLLSRAVRIEPELVSYNEVVTKCVRYTLNDFDRVGVFRYAGPPTANNTVDNYHSGFVLRVLDQLVPFIADQDHDLESRTRLWVNEGLGQYQSRFIKPHGVPKFAPSNHHIQAHSVAEASLVFSQFKDQIPESVAVKYRDSIGNSVQHLWNERLLQFDSEVRVVGGRSVWRNTTPMPRWAWAWTFLSMLSLST